MTGEAIGIEQWISIPITHQLALISANSAGLRASFSASALYSSKLQAISSGTIVLLEQLSRQIRHRM
jgi:hypothetical protein